MVPSRTSTLDEPRTPAGARADETVNERAARCLDELADLLDAQEANPFRVRAYHEAAATVRGLGHPLEELLASGGRDALRGLPGIGASLSATLETLARRGTPPLLQRLRGGPGPVDLFRTVPGLGPELAGRIHARLGLETLEDLEAAAHDGRLRSVPGLGPRRVEAVAWALAGRLGAQGRGRARRRDRDHAAPPVAEILDVDAEYRRRVQEGNLPTLAPRRFNPEGRAWLPVLHTRRGGRHYTALFSNTARAHRLGTTHDWVVVYQDDGTGDGQWTVTTGRSGVLDGRRVVRGREAECVARLAEPPPSGEGRSPPRPASRTAARARRTGTEARRRRH